MRASSTIAPPMSSAAGCAPPNGDRDPKQQPRALTHAVRAWDGAHSSHATPCAQCCLELGVTCEYIGRIQMAGFEEMREALSAMPIAKLYEISEGDVPTVCALTAPQKAADVA